MEVDREPYRRPMDKVNPISNSAYTITLKSKIPVETPTESQSNPDDDLQSTRPPSMSSGSRTSSVCSTSEHASESLDGSSSRKSTSCQILSDNDSTTDWWARDEQLPLLQSAATR